MEILLEIIIDEIGLMEEDKSYENENASNDLFWGANEFGVSCDLMSEILIDHTAIECLVFLRDLIKAIIWDDIEYSQAYLKNTQHEDFKKLILNNQN